MYAFFDLDGTLTDPQEGITACIRYALGELGVVAPTEAALRAWIGPPLQESFTTMLGTQVLAAQAVQLYHDRFARQGMFENRCIPGFPMP
jgi:phosphoglycolate phosphatase